MLSPFDAKNLILVTHNSNPVLLNLTVLQKEILDKPVPELYCDLMMEVW